MRIYYSILIFLILVSTVIYSQIQFVDFHYLDPLPNAKFINKETSIIIRPKENIQISTILEPGSISISGSLSGPRTFSGFLADDNKIAILKTSLLFVPGETVTMNFSSNIRKKNGGSINPFSYTFEVPERDIHIDEFHYSLFAQTEQFNSLPLILQPGKFNTGVPEISVTYSRFPSPGKLFFNNLVRTPVAGYVPHLLIVDNSGTTVFTREMDGPCYDLNLQPNGLITYFDGLRDKYFGLDSSYNVTDTFYCGNGYITDLHEMRILPNGNFLLMSYDTRNVDSIGTSFASFRAIGLIIQEIDRNRNVIFQWRSWDYFKITDATHENLGGPLIDYCHGNAIEADTDGNLLISSRNMDEITKINRLTGRLIWRLGGKNNEFTFLNDTIGFSHQHAIRRISNGNITLYDNGNFHNPPFSRAIEYKLDEVNKTAELVWQYRNSPDIYAPATGYVQRLSNNNTLICWGLTNPTLTEVRYDGTKVFEMTLPAGSFSYRAFRYEWKENITDKILPGSFGLLQNYPNPFNPSTTIKFTVPATGSESTFRNVKLSVYDITGKLVKVILNEQFSPGTYSINYDAGSISSGVYFYQISSDGEIETKKMVFVK